MASSGEPCFKISALEPLEGEGEGNEGLILIVFILHCALMSCFATLAEVQVEPMLHTVLYLAHSAFSATLA